jgi:hypothetical protein
MFPPQVSPPTPLNPTSHVVPILVPHRFEREQGFRVLDEGFRGAHLPFFFCDAGVAEDLLATGAGVAGPDVVAGVGGGGGEEVEAAEKREIGESEERKGRKKDRPLDHLLEGVAVSETSTTDSNVLLQPKVLDLMQNRLRVVLAWGAVLVRLDRSNVRRLTPHELLDKGVGGSLDLVTGGGRTLLAVGVGTVGEEVLKELVAAATDEVLEEDVLVLVGHTGDRVHDVSSVVLDEELAAASLELRVRETAKTLGEGVVGGGRVGVSGGASIVESGEDSRRALLLDEVADDLVVEVLDGCPLQGWRIGELWMEGEEEGIARTLICSRTYSSCSVLRVS